MNCTNCQRPLRPHNRSGLCSKCYKGACVVCKVPRMVRGTCDSCKELQATLAKIHGERGQPDSGPGIKVCRVLREDA